MTARRTRTLLAGAVATVAVAGACAPRFESGARAQVRTTGAYPVLDWPAAVEDDAGEEVASYRVEIGGDIAPAVVVTIAAPATECALVGLPARRSVELTVSAVDTAGERSAGLTTTLGTAPGPDLGPRPGCVPTTDTDGDRLPDAVEGDDGRFVDGGRAGTSPVDPDTDGDGLPDGDEALGTAAGLDLRAMGTTPTKKDVVLEYDWMDDAGSAPLCPPHSHRPTAEALQQVTDMYGAAPLTNPDGTRGIRLIHDYGQGGAFTGGNRVADADGILEGDVAGDQYRAVERENRAANRRGYVHYVVLAHELSTAPQAAGQAEMPGDDIVTAMRCGDDARELAQVLAHELGHNLGLHHGGDVATNDKPNYSSIMNYRYAYEGVDTDCDTVGDGPLGFSPGTREPVDERAVDERAGLCGRPFDWDRDGTIDASTYPRDLNGDGVLEVLRDHDDWARVAWYLDLLPLLGDLAPGGAGPVVVTDPPWAREG